MRQLSMGRDLQREDARMPSGVSHGFVMMVGMAWGRLLCLRGQLGIFFGLQV
jgi:hypothetical protein